MTVRSRSDPGSPRSFISCSAVRIGDSGLRSSCPSIARNSSFARFALSAAARAMGAEHEVADADPQVALRERLDDEVLGAVIEELHHQLLVGLGREQQDGRVLQLRARPHLRDHLDAAHVRHHDVRDDDHRIEAERLLDPLAAVERRHHVVVAAQALRDEAVHVGVVLDDQHARPPGARRAPVPVRPPSA